MSWLTVGYAVADAVPARGHGPALLEARTTRRSTCSTSGSRGMYERLPDWMRGGGAVQRMSCGSPTGPRPWRLPMTGGRSYTATIAVIDEATTRRTWTGCWMRGLRPTIDGGSPGVSVDGQQGPAGLAVPAHLPRPAGRERLSPDLPALVRAARPRRGAVRVGQAGRAGATGALDALHQEYPARRRSRRWRAGRWTGGLCGVDRAGRPRDRRWVPRSRTWPCCRGSTAARGCGCSARSALGRSYVMG